MFDGQVIRKVGNHQANHSDIPPIVRGLVNNPDSPTQPAPCPLPVTQLVIIMIQAGKNSNWTP